MDPATFLMAHRLADYRHNYAAKLEKLTDDQIKVLLSASYSYPLARQHVGSFLTCFDKSRITATCCVS